jgi:hypothetical protein
LANGYHLSWSVPTHIVLLETIPKTVSGKIDRRALDLANQTIPAPKGIENGNLEDTLVDETFCKIRKVWAEVLKLSEDDLGPGSEWSELGGRFGQCHLAVSKGETARTHRQCG